MLSSERKLYEREGYSNHGTKNGHEKKSEDRDSDKEEISNNNTSGRVLFNSAGNHESMNDTFGDDWEYMEGVIIEKKKIKKHKRYNTNKEMTLTKVGVKWLETNCHDQSGTTSNSSNDEENLEPKLKEKGSHRKISLGEET